MSTVNPFNSVPSGVKEMPGKLATGVFHTLLEANGRMKDTAFPLAPNVVGPEPLANAERGQASMMINITNTLFISSPDLISKATGP